MTKPHFILMPNGDKVAQAKGIRVSIRKTNNPNCKYKAKIELTDGTAPMPTQYIEGNFNSYDKIKEAVTFKAQELFDLLIALGLWQGNKPIGLKVLRESFPRANFDKICKQFGFTLDQFIQHHTTGRRV